MKKIIGLLIVIGIIGFAGYEALMYYDNNFRYGRMRETPAVRPYEEPMLKMETGLVPVSGGETVYRTAAGIDLASPLNRNDSAVIARGKAVYQVSSRCPPICAARRFNPHPKVDCLNPSATASPAAVNQRWKRP
jgi:hypothetical protein